MERLTKGRRERIEKGSRERIEIERKEKETKGSCDDDLKRRRRRNFTTCLKAPLYSSEDTSSQLDSTVKLYRRTEN